MARVRILALAIVLSAPLGAAAVDPPHESSGACLDCHMGHNAPGGSLTNTAGNANLCLSCHQTTPRFNWATTDQAVPGTSGTSHSWSAPATNLGATPPAPGTPMGSRLDAGNLQCSTCHEQHQADANLGTPADYENLGSQYVNIPIGTPATRSAGTGTGTMTLVQPAATSTPKFYRIEVVAGGSSTTATFRLSNDRGTSFFGCTAPGTYVPYVASPSNACVMAATVTLNDGSNVRVSFAGGAGAFVAGDRWDFYVSYPFLRVANKDGAMCVTCHQDRNMGWQDVEGGTGFTVFSHPVGQALNANGKNYDHPAPLDVNGGAQNSDGNASNDLVLTIAGRVTCLTCHSPHNSDSNSLTQ